MTLVVGILCTDGVVIGTDSATTQVQGQLPTIEQPNREKIKIIDNKAIIGGTGAVGLGQRFEHLVQKCMKDNSFRGKSPIEVSTMLSRVTIQDFQSTNTSPIGTNSSPIGYGALVAFPCKEEFTLVEFEVGTFQPELKTKSGWYVSMGAGKLVADPLLGLMRRVFWGDSPPTWQEGVFAATMVLTLGCWMAPQGVSEPIQIAVLAKGKNGKPLAQRISTEEHVENVKSAIEYFRGYTEKLFGEDDEPPELPSVST